MHFPKIYESTGCSPALSMLTQMLVSIMGEFSMVAVTLCEGAQLILSRVSQRKGKAGTALACPGMWHCL